MTTTETELVADAMRRMSDAELDREEARIERGRQCCTRRQDLERYNRRLVALTAERMRRDGSPKSEVRSPKSESGDGFGVWAQRRGRFQGAFSLVELLAVVAVLGVLAAAMVPSVARAARAASAKAAWCRHFQEARTWQLDLPTETTGQPYWVAMTTSEAFRWCYPEYRSFAEVPRSTVRYWLRQREVAVVDGN